MDNEYSNNTICSDESSIGSFEDINYHDQNTKKSTKIKRSRPLVGEEITTKIRSADEDRHAHDIRKGIGRENCVCYGVNRTKLLDKRTGISRSENSFASLESTRSNPTKRLRRERKIRYSEHMINNGDEIESCVLPPTGYQIRHNLTGNEIDGGIDSSSDDEYTLDQQKNESMTKKLTEMNQKNKPFSTADQEILGNVEQFQYTKPVLATQSNIYENDSFGRYGDFANSTKFTEWNQEDDDDVVEH